MNFPLMKKDASWWIENLKLSRHVEGGSFRETYRSPLKLPKNQIGEAFAGDRAASTCIYFLLEAGQFSAFHRIASDEAWHFYEGDPLDVFEIFPDGTLVTHRLGRDPEAGQSFQVVIQAGNWFGSRVAAGGEFSLVGCTVAPGFDFADFELATSAQLGERYPEHSALISEMTYS